MSGDPRVEQAERRLRELGVSGGRVRVAGHDCGIAAVVAPAAEFERLLGDGGEPIARALRELGFRYVALDLDPGD